MGLSIDDFIARWRVSGAEERANKDLFFTELCEALDVPRPTPKTGDPTLDTYVFEADVVVPHDGRPTSVDAIDVYRAGHFVFEAKQADSAEKTAHANKKHEVRRDTPAWGSRTSGVGSDGGGRRARGDARLHRGPRGSLPA